MQEHVVEAKDRRIAFTGERIGKATTQAPGKDRWAEVQIFRTRGGQFVVAGVGRSLLAGETDRHWAHSSESPEGVIEALYLFDDDGVRYLPHVNRRALDQASRNDPRLAAAMSSYTEHVA